MLPPMWRIEACMNIAVNTVSQAGIGVPGTALSQHPIAPRWRRPRQCGPEWVSALGIAPYLNTSWCVRAADQRAAVADRQHVDDDVGQDQRDRDEREPIGRDVVLDRDHRRCSLRVWPGPLGPREVLAAARRGLSAGDGRVDGGDPPRLGGVAVERERPALGESWRACWLPPSTAVVSRSSM